MRHTDRLSGISTYGLNGLEKGDEPKLHSEYYGIFIFTFSNNWEWEGIRTLVGICLLKFL